MGRNLRGHGGRDVNRHRQQAQVNPLGKRADVRPIVAFHHAHLVIRLLEPLGEKAAHLALSAHDEHLGPGPHAAPPERVQLPHARVAQHRPEQVLHVIRVQSGLRGLGAAGGDEILLAGRVKSGQVVLLFDLGDLLNHAASLGQQIHQLLVNAVNLLAELVELVFVRDRLFGFALGGLARLGFLVIHGANLATELDSSSRAA